MKNFYICLVILSLTLGLGLPAGVDPVQEERNREDLRIIYGRGQN